MLKKEKNYQETKEKGITLIALVITIIVLLILAGVTIATLTGENGILTRSTEVDVKTRAARLREEIDLWKMNIEVDNYTKDIKAEELDEFLDRLENEGAITEEEKNTIKETGKVTIGEETIVFVTIADKVKVGDYVEYNPTITDKSGTAVEASKLTYTSPIGTIPTEEGKIITHGNGDSEQTFTAKNDVKWRVLSVDKEQGTVNIVAENPIKTDAGTNYKLKGAIGYLYAEEEINKACSIYGYGYGADTSLSVEYEIGGPFDEEKSNKIEETGARSINVEDINKAAGLKTEQDLKNISSSYNEIIEWEGEIFYPTLKSTNTSNPGQSTNKSKEYLCTYYSYRKDRITDDTLKEMIFDTNDMYWLSSRCTAITLNTVLKSIRYHVFYISTTGGILDCTSMCGISMLSIFDGNTPLYQSRAIDFGIRPVVTLKSDIQVEKNEDGVWILK